MKQITSKYLTWWQILIVIISVPLLIFIVVKIAAVIPQQEIKQPQIIQASRVQQIPAPPSAQFPNKQYDLMFFYADGRSKQFQASANYTDVTVMINSEVVSLGDANSNTCAKIFSFLYNQQTGLLTACSVYGDGVNILFRGVSR